MLSRVTQAPQGTSKEHGVTCTEADPGTAGALGACPLQACLSALSLGTVLVA